MNSYNAFAESSQSTKSTWFEKTDQDLQLQDKHTTLGQPIRITHLSVINLEVGMWTSLSQSKSSTEYYLTIKYQDRATFSFWMPHVKTKQALAIGVLSAAQEKNHPDNEVNQEE